MGGSCDIYLDAWPDHPYRGRVDRIWPTANRQKATVEVRVAIDKKDDRLRPEMGVRVVFFDKDRVAPLAGAGPLVGEPSPPRLCQVRGRSAVALRTAGI